MTITTNNEGHGFHGTYLLNHDASPKQAATAFNQCAQDLVGFGSLTKDEARDFLDSRLGRHLCDALPKDFDLEDYPPYLAREIQRWKLSI